MIIRTLSVDPIRLGRIPVFRPPSLPGPAAGCHRNHRPLAASPGTLNNRRNLLRHPPRKRMIIRTLRVDPLRLSRIPVFQPPSLPGHAAGCHRNHGPLAASPGTPNNRKNLLRHPPRKRMIIRILRANPIRLIRIPVLQPPSLPGPAAGCHGNHRPLAASPGNTKKQEKIFRVTRLEVAGGCVPRRHACIQPLGAFAWRRRFRVPRTRRATEPRVSAPGALGYSFYFSGVVPLPLDQKTGGAF